MRAAGARIAAEPSRARRKVPAIFALLLLVGGRGAAGAAPYEPTTLVYPTFKHDLGLHHVGDFHLRLFTGNQHRFRDPRGIAAVKLVETDKPEKTGDDDELTVFGVNAGESCVIYNSSQTTLASYGSKGSGSGSFLDPCGIAANPAGDVYVADSGNDRIVHLRYRAGKLTEVKTIPSARGDPVPFERPLAVALATNGDLYVADTGHDRIVVADRSGAYRRSFGAGFLSAPEAIAVLDLEERWSYRKDAFLVVIDRGGKRISKFGPDGTVSKSVSAADLGVPAGRFRGVAIDYYHQIYVTDEAENRIHKLAPDLAPITSFGREGSGDAEFRGPFGITVWRRFGQFFISERTGAQYYWVGVDILGARAEPVVFRPSGTIRFFLTERARTSVSVENEEGKTLRTLANDRLLLPGERKLRWDGKDDTGAALPAGRYRVRIRARATYSSSKYFEKNVAFPLALG